MGFRRDRVYYFRDQRYGVFDRGRNERGICVGDILYHVDRGSDDLCGDGDADGALHAETSGDRGFLFRGRKGSGIQEIYRKDCLFMLGFKKKNII